MRTRSLVLLSVLLLALGGLLVAWGLTRGEDGGPPRTASGAPPFIEQRLDRVECTLYGENCPATPEPSAPASPEPSTPVEPSAPTSAEPTPPPGTPEPPAPTPPPTPTPTPAGPSLSRADYPGPDTTGVPPGVQLRAVAGTVTASKPGQVIDGLDIAGKLVITAPGVVVRNTRVTTGGNYPVTVETGGDATIIDSEIDGGGKASVGVCCKRYTLLRVEVRNSVDGLRADGQVTATDSWVHDLARTSGSHNDTVQMLKGDGVTLHHNALEPRTGDDPRNAAFIISAGASGGPVSNVRLTSNWLDGGNYTLYLGEGGTYPVTGVVVDGNVFAGGPPKGNARYGAARALTSDAVWTASNVYSTGARVR